MNADYTPGAFALVVKRSRTGLGLFAGCVIPERACVVEYKGRTLYGDEWYSVRSRYLFVVDATKVIDGSPRANLARYINHSCSPNCVPDIHRRRVFIRATRRIEAGEELGYDYGAEYFQEFIAPRGCRCASCEPPPP